MQWLQFVDIDFLTLNSQQLKTNVTIVLVQIERHG